MSPATQAAATLADLMRYDGKAELIGGRIVPQMPTGEIPNLIAGEIYSDLKQFAKKHRRGRVYTDNMGFTVPILSSGRESFSPDVAYYDGPSAADRMNFIADTPTFAVEVRSKSNYGSSEEDEMAAKRADYFEAGTKVVWDVDTVAEVVRKYQADAPEQPTLFARGQEADAEPAVPGWRMAVDRIFDV